MTLRGIMGMVGGGGSIKKNMLPNWIVYWFWTTAVICTWDATFIMLRPHTLPGGSLHWIWYLYKYYIVVDQRYQDISDSFVFAQSLLNYLEVVLNIVTLVMHTNRSKHTVTTAFMVSVMTFWKTVLYFLMFTEFCTGGVYRQGNSTMDEILLVVIPNIIWVIMPLAVMIDLWGVLTSTTSSRQKEEAAATATNGVSKSNGYSSQHRAAAHRQDHNGKRH